MKVYYDNELNEINLEGLEDEPLINNLDHEKYFKLLTKLNKNVGDNVGRLRTQFKKTGIKIWICDYQAIDNLTRVIDQDARHNITQFVAIEDVILNYENNILKIKLNVYDQNYYMQIDTKRGARMKFYFNIRTLGDKDENLYSDY